MKKLSLFILLLLFLAPFVHGQVFDVDLHITGQIKLVHVQDTTKPTTPPVGGGGVVFPPTTFEDFIGVNTNIQLATEGRGNEDDHLREMASIFKIGRTFMLTEHDMVTKNGVKLPFKDTFPFPNLSKCPNISTGWDGSTNAQWKLRFCVLDNLFDVNIASPELIYLPDGKGGIIEKKYPNKSLNEADMGGDPYWAGFKFADYVSKSLGDEIEYLEAWNEPHGSPTVESHNIWAQGVKDNLIKNKSSIKLMSSDRQATGTEYFNGEPINTSVFDIDTSIYDAIQCHSYTFDDNFDLTYPPEKGNKNYFAQLQEIKDLAEWNKGAKELYLTEFGFSSNSLGEPKQADYILRTILHAMRYGFKGATIYQLQDEPWAFPFSSCGLLDSNGEPKASYKLLKYILIRYGDYHFEKALKESDSEWSYQFTNGSKSVIFSWSIDTKIEINESK